ncbi:LysR family transcriptional regulator [Pseudobacteriovorax antillogorgiicola]|uniref:DNA-binding transcriptional regulator, LysR family n=1 Tax=Pseudobacteriovorax antillogorgiicola TaxID=1513793 RepID=A0A1Y6BAL4_9BACT|nr:LysR family transcriptional regulator [Pseudobacteriovorax antillogorgiicola]TCS57564.1 DNA-binding transcriptional LysR family regulator [Pseudobacteriovorax antillogorgiicola]SME99749.1 DNA-binding transcriptional regulator, LysR family [Pseudobacteriovorax antillogorgiicola]
MTLDQLKVLLCIIDTGSFRGAAERLHRAQSAVSYAIKALEDELGFKLFDRNRHRSELTAEGRMLYQRALALVEESDNLERFCRGLAQSQERELRLRVSSLCPLKPLSRVFSNVTHQFPEVSLDLNVSDSETIVRSLLAREFDIGISHHKHLVEGLEVLPWGSIDLVPVAVPHCPLSNHLWAESLPQITLDHQKSTPDLDGDYNRMQPGKLWQVNQMSSQLELIREGLGWGFVPHYKVAHDLRVGSLMLLDISKPVEVSFFLYRNRHELLREAAQSLWSQLETLSFSADARVCHALA